MPPIGQSQPYVRGDKGVWIIKFIENFSGHRISKKVGKYGFEEQKFVLILCVDRKKKSGQPTRGHKTSVFLQGILIQSPPVDFM